MRIILMAACIAGLACSALGQSYFLDRYAPYDSGVMNPADFLGYDIGDYHTRHDRMVAYLEYLSKNSDRANLIDYGKTHELRRLVILQVSNASNLSNIDELQNRHLELVDPDSDANADVSDLPIFVNLGYNVHGNEPSGGEAALVTAYILVASQHPAISRLRSNSIVFIDPAINPDGRDRHTQWANSLRSVNALVADPMDAEHNEFWPRGRTNHYWFDLNRDWLLAVHPESQGKLDWYHEWYPNVVTDFHEMGTNSTYFFEPMKPNGSQDPIMPIENYTTLNDTFARYFYREMDSLGSLYFTKEVFDGTYPGYGSSYPDLQGGLGILFEQASSRGHLQRTAMGEMTFAYTIRHQLVNAIATVEAAVDHKDLLHDYQRSFFQSAIDNANAAGIASYVFGDDHDRTRLHAFVRLLLRHRVEVYPLESEVTIGDYTYRPNEAFVVPTAQPQYRMVQSMFETYDEYRDSVYYDASAWSLANAYNMRYAKSATTAGSTPVDETMLVGQSGTVERTEYAYLASWDDYNSPGFLYHLQSNGALVKSSQRPFSINTHKGNRDFSYGSLVIPVDPQPMSPDSLWSLVSSAAEKWGIEVFSAHTGYSTGGIDLGSRWAGVLETPQVLSVIGNGVSGYEAGFLWHLLDQRVEMPLTKVHIYQFGRVDLEDYNVLVLVSGNYSSFDSIQRARIASWVSQGNTLITLGSATRWAIQSKLSSAELLKPEKDTAPTPRFDYATAGEVRGKDEVGGAIFEVDLDITHPIGFGYTRRKLPVYRNNSIWVRPLDNEFSNVAMYTEDPHIDGFITEKNLESYLKNSASIVVIKKGAGRIVHFSDDPNFRGTWYGTNKLFLNAVFFGQMIRVP